MAVKGDGYALRYVKDQTDEICLEAVRSNGIAIGYVIPQTVELCEIALANPVFQGIGCNWDLGDDEKRFWCLNEQMHKIFKDRLMMKC